MTGIVLALAGLTCGDGGMQTGAAREPVAFSPGAGEWEGEVYWPGDPAPPRVVRISKGQLIFDDGAVARAIDFRPDGVATLEGEPWGVYARERKRLVIRSDGVQIYLRPAAPLKP